MKAIHCPRCRERLEFAGQETLQLGAASPVLGNLPNLLAGGLAVEIYVCKKCGKLELFSPLEQLNDSDSIAKVTCRRCGKPHDIDFPRCPYCGYSGNKD